MSIQKFRLDMRKIRKELEHYQEEILGQAHDIATDIADEAREWMKTNASWTDQTGAARESLDTEVDTTNDRIIIRFFYDLEVLLRHEGNVRRRDYSPFLEASRFEILIPAMNLWSQEFLSRLKNIR